MSLTKPKTIKFTSSGFNKLKKDQKELGTKREQVLIRLQTAREMGDLSENAAYHAAKFELGNIDRKLRQIIYLLKFGKVSKPSNTKSIQFGHLITLKTQNQQITYTLVNSHESDPSKNKLSIDSPLGILLLGKKPGDKVTLKTPEFSTTYAIEKVTLLP